jgi:hypothetical protein
MPIDELRNSFYFIFKLAERSDINNSSFVIRYLSAFGGFCGSLIGLAESHMGLSCIMKFHKSGVSGQKNGQSDQKRNFWGSVWKSAVVGFRISQ